VTAALSLLSVCTIRSILSLIYPVAGIGILAMGMLFWGAGDGSGG
jgi:hypothetical protein